LIMFFPTSMNCCAHEARGTEQQHDRDGLENATVSVERVFFAGTRT
jgi:hypothetical protein